jgi:hypothetical protein
MSIYTHFSWYMYLKLCEIIRCCCWNLSSAISPATRNPLPRHQSATNPLYAIYYLDCNIAKTSIANDPKISLQHSKIICCNIPCNTGRGNRTPELVGTLAIVASLRSRGGERGGGLRSREEPAYEWVEEVRPMGWTSDKERYRLSKVLEGPRPLY